MTTRVPAQMVGLSPISGNNAAQINDAITKLAAAGGGTVELAAGSWPITASIVMAAGVDLVGQGMTATVIQPTGVDGITFGFTSTYANTSIKNLSVVGTTTTDKVGIYQAGTTSSADELYGITLEGVGVRQFNIAAKFRTVRNVTISNCWFQDVNSGLHLIGKCLVVNIRDSKIVKAAGSGTGTQYAILCDAYTYAVGGSIRPEAVKVRDSHIYGFEQGVTFEGVVYGFVNGCDIQATVNGVTWSSADALLDVSKNYIQIAGAAGAAAVYGKAQASVLNTSIRVRDNHINGVSTTAGTSYGVLLGTAVNGNQDNVTVEGNSFTGFTLYDIAVYKSGHIRISGNECYSSGTTGSILTSALPGASRPVYIDRNDCAKTIDTDSADRISGAVRLGDNIVSGTTVSANPWQTPTFAAGDFTANGAMTWTVDAGDVTTYAWRQDGKMMTVLITLATTTVGGTPNTQLQIKVPGGRTAAKRAINPCFILDNNVRTTGYLDVAAGGTNITVNRTDGANWTASTNLTYVYGQITFEVQ